MKLQVYRGSTGEPKRPSILVSLVNKQNQTCTHFGTNKLHDFNFGSTNTLNISPHNKWKINEEPIKIEKKHELKIYIEGNVWVQWQGQTENLEMNEWTKEQIRPTTSQPTFLYRLEEICIWKLLKWQWYWKGYEFY